MRLQLLLLFFVLGCSVKAQNIIYYSSEEDSMGRDLFALNTTGKKDKLTQNKGQGHYPHYINPKLSPDGATLVFQADTDGHDRYAIWPTNNDRTELKRNNSN